MKQRALVIRTYGDQEMARSIAGVMESPELKRLRAQIGVSQPRQNKDYAKKIAEARKKYSVKPMSPFRQKFWGAIGLLVVLAHGGVQ